MFLFKQHITKEKITLHINKSKLTLRIVEVTKMCNIKDKNLCLSFYNTEDDSLGLSFYDGISKLYF